MLCPGTLFLVLVFLGGMRWAQGTASASTTTSVRSWSTALCRHPAVPVLAPHRPVLPPQVSLAFEDIRNEKVKVLRSMRPVSLEDTVLGQYRSRATAGGKTLPGYLDDKTVPAVRTGEADRVGVCRAVRCGTCRARFWRALRLGPGAQARCQAHLHCK